MGRFNVLYEGRLIHTDLSHEECAEILQTYSERFFSGEDLNPELIELKEMNHGNDEGRMLCSEHPEEDSSR